MLAFSPGFGIADEEYQLSALRRIGVPPKWQKRTLKAFTSHRFIGDYKIDERDAERYRAYQEFLAKRNLLDFDMLVIKAAEILRIESVAQEIRSRWDSVLVDEFQDLTPVQYMVIRSLAQGSSQHLRRRR